VINLKSKFVEEKYDELLDLGNIDNDLYEKFNVKKGLRNANGTGVLVELTKVANVHGYSIDENGNKIDSEGLLSFRGVDIYDLARIDKSVYGYEKTCYLLLFGRLPNDEEFEQFKEIISECYELPQEFINNIITRGVSENLMNHIMRSILALYTFDSDPDNTDPLATLEKCLQ
jgi:citrate synthase